MADVAHSPALPSLQAAYAAYARGDLAAARSATGEALALDAAVPEAWMLQGVLARAAGEVTQARRAYEEALRLRPAYAEARFNLANLLAQTGENEAALAQFEQAVALRPDFAAAWAGLGTQRLQVNRVLQAMAAYQQAVRLEPADAGHWNNLGKACWVAGEVESAVAAFRQSLQLRPDNVQAHDNLLTLLHYDPRSDAATLLAEHRHWQAQHAATVMPLPPAPSLPVAARTEPARLRLGLVSWNFRRDAAGCFIASLLEGLDRKAFEVYVYADNPGGDAYTAHFRELADAWVESHPLDDAALAARVRADGVDIFIDLTGHTGRSRLLAFARRPAPVQVSGIGYEGTTGLAAMDWLMGDRHVTPRECDALCSERVLRLPFGFQCYFPPRDAPAVAPPPVLKNGFITFGSFNKPAKLNAGVLDTWAALLQLVPDARLLLKSAALADAGLCEVFRQRFEQRGIARSRVLFRGGSGYVEALSEYADMDIALDPFPFSGGATTCDALWMGVPVVTLRGQTFAANHTVSHLNAAGFAQWIAASPAEYVALATALARDVPGLADWRLHQRDLMAASPLCDARSYMTHVGLGLRSLWRSRTQTPKGGAA